MHVFVSGHSVCGSVCFCVLSQTVVCGWVSVHTKPILSAICLCFVCTGTPWSEVSTPESTNMHNGEQGVCVYVRPFCVCVHLPALWHKRVGGIGAHEFPCALTERRAWACSYVHQHTEVRVCTCLGVWQFPRALAHNCVYVFVFQCTWKHTHSVRVTYICVLPHASVQSHSICMSASTHPGELCVFLYAECVWGCSSDLPMQ